jgi:hypothetical protein
MYDLSKTLETAISRQTPGVLPIIFGGCRRVSNKLPDPTQENYNIPRLQRRRLSGGAMVYIKAPGYNRWGRQV